MSVEQMEDATQQHSTTLDHPFQDIEELIAVLKLQEKSKYICARDYFADGQRAHGVDEAWRQRMCEWMYGLVDHCNFRRDIVAVSATYLDLCLSKDSEIIDSRRSYQLAAMTSIYLAMKVYDTSFVKLESLIKLGRGMFRIQDVVQMERRIIEKLEWNLHPPTPMCFVRHFMRLFPTTISPSTTYMVAEVSRFVAEISICLYKFVKYPPSIIAYSSLLIAMSNIDERSLPFWQRQQIYIRICNVAKLNHNSESVQRVTRKLRASFEKNVDLKSLMTTIDPTCQVCCVTSKTAESYPAEEESPKSVERVA